jgi:hypothetical protein
MFMAGPDKTIPIAYVRRANVVASCAAGLVLLGCNIFAPGGGAARSLPSLVSAKSLSSHYVEVIFDQPLSDDFGQPSSYKITAAENSAPLAVRAAKMSDDEFKVILTTDAQSEVDYRLALIDGLPLELRANAGPPTMTFSGSLAYEMTLGYAVALSNTTLLLTFSDAVTDSASETSSYAINNPDLAVISAERGTGANANTVVLTTSPQSDQLYTMEVANIANTHSLIDPDANTATFFGIEPTDGTAPRLIRAEPKAEDQVLLTFSEPLENFVNHVTSYSVDNGATVVGATPNDWNTQVRLYVLPMVGGITYSASVHGVEDRAGNVIDPEFDTASFVYTALGGGTGDTILPRVTGAISTSNRTVVVSYNKPMSDSAMVPSNYFIVQQNQQPEAGYLGVTGARFLDDSRRAVELTTLSQSELTYFLRVVNVEDTEGNQMAPPELFVDPAAAAVFPGTPPSCRPACAAESSQPEGLGNGVCDTDDDCDDNPPCRNGETDCSGMCEDRCEAVDSDGDGLTDGEEQRGWVVLVELSTRRGEHDEREIIRRDVTSNPFQPDTDRDGLNDALEKQIDTDPRDKDTDDDQVPDEREYNLHYSNPVDQDSDDDDIDDFLEIDLFLTSAIMADTDGDQMSDAEELYERSRNPLIADLPLPQVLVDEISLELEVKSSYTDEESQTQSMSETTSATFTDSRTNSLGTSSTNSTESENTFGQKIGAEGGSAGWKISGEVSFGQSQSHGYSTTVDSETSQTSQQEYQESVTNGLEFSESRSVTRTIESAIVQATVNIGNLSDIAFSITNLELSLLQQDRNAGLTFRPIASLRPTAATDPTGQPVFNIGPLEEARGPVIFENTSIFPNRVDALMREPTGLVVKVVNFDVLDEFGRNLVFTTQEVMDRTVALTIDFGDGRVELYRIATANDFNENAQPNGISMRRALEIAGLTHDTVDSTAPNTYATIVDMRLLEGGETIDAEALVRVRDVANSADGKKFWTAVSSNLDLDPNSDFRDIQLFAHDVILIMFTSDVDGDKLFLREEYLYGSDDTLTNSDGDELDDFDEVRVGWTVAKVPGLPYKTFPSPARPDSDLDGLADHNEKSAGTDPNRLDTDEDGRSDPSELADTYTIGLFDGDTDSTNTKVLTVTPYSDWAVIAGADGVCDTTVPTGDDTAVTQNGTGAKLCIASGPNGIIDTDPLNDDAVIAAAKIDPGPDGICDTTTAAGDDVVEFSVASAPPVKGSIGKVCISAGADGTIDTAALDDDFLRVAHKGLFGTDPVRHDTDTDGINDGREVILGINPNSKDAGKVVDTDRDGLFDDEEDTGWLVAGTTTRVLSDKNLADSDHDGIPDVLERAIGSNPSASDTDGDTLLDYVEFDESNPVVNVAPLYDAVLLDASFTRCANAPNCSYTPPHSSLITSTDPARRDTDGDTRNDNVEVNEPWNVQVFGGTATQVFSDPLFADKDGDSLNDAGERTALTDPEDPDTDGDGRNDGPEVTAGRNPLRQDYSLTVTLLRVHVVGDCDSSTCEGMELKGSLLLRRPNGTEVTLHTEGCKTEECACEVSDCCDSARCEGENVDINFGTTFTFQQGETFTLFTTTLQDHDDLDCDLDALSDDIGSASDDFPFSLSLGTTFSKTIGGSGCEVRADYTLVKND